MATYSAELSDVLAGLRPTPTIDEDRALLEKAFETSLSDLELMRTVRDQKVAEFSAKLDEDIAVAQTSHDRLGLALEQIREVVPVHVENAG